MASKRVSYPAILSLLIAFLFSVIYVPSTLKAYWPPLIVMVYFYWLIFKGLPSGPWWAWLLGLCVGCLLGEPLGLNSFLMLWFAFPLFLYQRSIRFLPIVNAWFLWIVLTILYVILKLLLLGVLGHAVTFLVIVKPLLGVLLFSVVIVFCLSGLANHHEPKRGVCR